MRVDRIMGLKTNAHAHTGQSHSPNVWDKPDGTWLHEYPFEN